MKIGELAWITRTGIETIRHYESRGLLSPTPRTAGNLRIYTPAHAERLSFIRHCRSLDMSLKEIGRLLHFKDSPAEPCADVNALHGFRAMFRTIGRERLNIAIDVLEAQLAHAKRDEVQKAYDRTRFDDARREAMQKWADYLDKLRTIGPAEQRKAA